MAINIQITASINGAIASACFTVDHLDWVCLNAGESVEQDDLPHGLNSLHIDGPTGSFVFVPMLPPPVSWWRRLL